MTYLLFLDYLLNVANGLGVAAILIGGFGAIFSTLFEAMSKDLHLELENIPSSRAFMVAFVVGVALASAPDKKLVFGVLAADYMINETVASALPPKAVAALNKYLDSYLADSDKAED